MINQRLAIKNFPNKQTTIEVVIKTFRIYTILPYKASIGNRSLKGDYVIIQTLDTLGA